MQQQGTLDRNMSDNCITAKVPDVVTLFCINGKFIGLLLFQEKVERLLRTYTGYKGMFSKRSTQ